MSLHAIDMDKWSPIILTLVTFIPLAGALLLLLLPRRDRDIRVFSLVVSLLTFVLSLHLPVHFHRALSGFQYELDRAWIPMPNIHYHMGVDGISMWLVVLTTFLTPLCVLISWKSIHERVKEFFIILLVLETALIGVFVALDLFLFYFFWEATLIPMALLIGMYGHGRKVYAAIKFFMYTMIASVFMLAAILWLYAKVGTFDFVTIQNAIRSGQVADFSSAAQWLFLGFFIAFAVKVPLFPLFPQQARANAWWVMILALIGIVYGALVALVQPNMKKLIAYSSISHLGFVVLGIFSFTQAGLDGATFVMLAHGVSTGALFMLAGALYERRHTYEISEFGGLASSMPVYASFFLFVVLASVGLPLLNGFVGEFLVLSGAFQARAVYGILGATGVIWSAGYLLWMYQRVFFGKITHPVNEGLPDLDTRERIALLPAAAAALVMGVAPLLWLNAIDPAVQTALAPFTQLVGKVVGQ